MLKKFRVILVTTRSKVKVRVHTVGFHYQCRSCLYSFCNLIDLKKKKIFLYQFMTVSLVQESIASLKVKVTALACTCAMYIIAVSHKPQKIS